jgi:ring-1,2-phenylacetyl-CoA epoxidase subunit PaaE
MDQIHWKVVKISPETSQASTIFLQNRTNDPVSYQAGQFLTLLFPHHGEPLRRSYSFSSTPGLDPVISITVKRVPNGTISRHLLGHVKPGDELRSLMPAGRFTIDTKPSARRQIFFFAAGSGITPIFSLLKKILNEESNTLLVLVYQNRNEKDIIFKEPLEELAKKNAGRFTWVNLLSRPAAHHRAPQKLTNFLVEQLITVLQRPGRNLLFYLCGPVSFMRMIQFTVRWMGFAENQIKKEFFTVEQIPAPPLMRDKGIKQITLHHHGDTHRFTIAYPTNILQAALNHHIALPFSCRAGRCSTCVAKCLSGNVKMSVNEVLTEDDLRNGLVLTCVGFAETDVELEI